MNKALCAVGSVLLLTGVVSAQTGNTNYGLGALENNTTGDYNSAFGYYTLHCNTTGYRNTATGTYAMYFNTTGHRNTATGYQSLHDNTTGYRNTATGYQSLYDNTTGGDNTAHGYKSLYANTTGYSNTAHGYCALCRNTTGYHNTATGYLSLFTNTTGYRNTATGSNVLYSNTTGYGNTAYGYSALYSNTTGTYNTATGFSALYFNTTGYHNTAHGYYALRSNTTGSYNTATGDCALYNNTTGYRNTAHGSHTLRYNTTGYRNTAIGSYALYYNTGSYNTAIGSQSLYDNTTGYRNTAIGYNALYNNTTGYYNTAIGYYSGPSSSNLCNSTALGYNTRTTASHQVRIGNSLVTSIGGQVSWTTLSDARFKQDVKQDVPGLAFIKKLRPVSYTINTQALNAFLGIEASSELPAAVSHTDAYTTGFIAQEVEALVQESGFVRFSGVDAPKNNRDYYGIRYSEFVVPLVKAVQELSDIVEKQQLQIAEQQKQINMLLNKKNEEQRIDALDREKTEINGSDALPYEFSAQQCHPNPFNKTTSIEFCLPKACNVELTVYNMLGQKVAMLVSGQMKPGYHTVTWDASGVSAGTYFYQLQTGDFTAKKKMLLVK
jgi:hypothetical protein